MKKLIKFFTYEEINKLIKASKNKDDKLAIALGAGSGLRISEIFGSKKYGYEPLTENNINLDTHQIRVFGKGQKERITCTSKWLNQTNIKYLPMKSSQRAFQYRFDALCLKVLGKKGNVHQLRHSFGNYMANEKNLPIPMLQQLMGHSRIDTTGIYTKANPKQAIERAWESF